MTQQDRTTGGYAQSWLAKSRSGWLEVSEKAREMKLLWREVVKEWEGERCRWWLTRHFCAKQVEEIQKIREDYLRSEQRQKVHRLGKFFNQSS